MATVTSFSIQKTYNEGNYESLRLGCDFSVDSGDDVSQIASKAQQMLDDIHAQMRHKQPMTAASIKKTPVTPERVKQELEFGSVALQQLLNRIALVGTVNPKNGDVYTPVTREMVDSNYILDEESSKAVDLAIALNTPKNS